MGRLPITQADTGLRIAGSKNASYFERKDKKVVKGFVLAFYELHFSSCP